MCEEGHNNRFPCGYNLRSSDIEGNEAKCMRNHWMKDVVLLQIPRTHIHPCPPPYTQDARKSLENDIQKVTDNYCKRADELSKLKSDELMKI